jgi:DNA polymerase-1
MLALDLETYPITPGCVIPKPVCYSVADLNGSAVGPIAHLRLPNGPDDRIVGANIAFDMAVLYQHLNVDVWSLYEAKQVTDVQVRQQLIDIAKGVGTKRKYSLKALAERLLGIVLDKEDVPRTEYYKVDGLPVSEWPQEYVDYARKDAEVTYQVWKAQEDYLDANSDIKSHVHQWEHYESYSAFCLHLMAAWGVRADGAWVSDLMADVAVKYEKLCQTYRDMGVMRPDGSKDKKVLQQLVYTAYNGNPPRTDKGAIKTDRLTLEESGNTTLESLTGDGPVEKIVTTYGKVVQDAALRVYNSRYNVLVSSGRTSSNFQQWPRGGPNAPEEVNRLRGCFKARPGYLFCSVDFTGAELVGLAQVCYRVLGFSHLRDALNAGQNLHTRLAARFVGCTYEQAAARLKAKDPVLVRARQGAKPVNFGLPGMMGPERLVGAAHKDFVFFCELSGINKQCNGSLCYDCLKLAKEYSRLYKEEWPEVPAYHKWVFANLSDPWPTPVTGFLRGGLFPSEAANHPFQHLTSRMAKSALIALARECYTDPSSVLRGARPWGFAHDEILAELPVANASSAADRMCDVMLAAAQKWTPDVLVTAEPALMERWWKGAECVRDASGKLLVWSPKHD